MIENNKLDSILDKKRWKSVELSEILREYNEKAKKGQTYEHVSLTKEGVVPKTDRYNRDFLVKSNDKDYRITHVDDICYNPANLKFGVICRNKYKDSIFSPIYVTFKVGEGYDPAFIEYMVTRNDFIDYALKFQEGTVYERMAVSPSDLLSIVVEVPPYDDQKTIASIIGKIDSIINAGTEVIALLEEQKKTLFKKIINRSIVLKKPNGDAFPEWKKQKISDIGRFSKGGSLSKEDAQGETTPCVLYGHLYTEYQETIEDVKYKTDSNNCVFAKYNDVLFPASTTADAFSLISPSVLLVDKVALGGDIIVFRPNQNISGTYVSYYVNHILKNRLAAFAQGSTIIHIQSKNIGPREIPVPSYEEQEAISNVLLSYDKLISERKNKIETWTNIRNSVIQKIFNSEK